MDPDAPIIIIYNYGSESAKLVVSINNVFNFYDVWRRDMYIYVYLEC